MPALMIQGCGSNVGKSMLVEGLCRAAMRRGLTVAPFKPQNMSNNAAVTVDGGEIGRAQALQALACGLAPVTDMNPVPLKLESEVGSQVVVQGRRVATVKARDYAALKPSLMVPVLESFHRLAGAHDLVIWRFCARRAGTLTLPHMCGGAGMFWASVAAIRCWAASWQTPKELRGQRGRHPVWAIWIFKP